MKSFGDTTGLNMFSRENDASHEQLKTMIEQELRLSRLAVVNGALGNIRYEGSKNNFPAVQSAMGGMAVATPGETSEQAVDNVTEVDFETSSRQGVHDALKEVA